MSCDKHVGFPLLDDDDGVWQRWIEQQNDKLDILFDDDAGPQETAGRVEWLQRLTQLLTVSSKRQEKRRLDYFDFHDVDAEDCAEFNDALCALFTALHSQLESLTFNSYKNELFLCFRFVPPMTQLRALDLSGKQCTGQGERIAELLRKCPNLTSLNLSHCELNDSDFAAIASVQCSSLEILDISRNVLTTQGLRSVAAMLKGCNQIRRVYFTVSDPEADFSGSYEVLASLTDKQRLEVLHCSDSVLAEDNVRLLQSMVNLKDLSIRISGAGSDFECFCDGIRRMRSLSNLDLKCDDEFSSENDRVFVEVLRSLDQLTELHFTCADSTASLKHLGEYIASADCRLRELYFCDGDKNVVLPVVSALKHNVSLRSFKMWRIPSDDALAQVLGQSLRHNRTLRSLSWVRGLSVQQWMAVLEGAQYSAIESLHVHTKGKMNDEMRRLLEDVANQGHLVKAGYGQASEPCKQQMLKNKQMRDAVRKAAFMLLAVRRFRKSALNALQKDIVKMIAKSLFAIRANGAWSDASVVREEPEQKKQKM